MKILQRISISQRAFGRPGGLAITPGRFISSDASEPTQSRLPTAPTTRFISPTHTAPASTLATETISRGEKYILPVYDRPHFVLSHGKGSYVWDTDGRKYLDFSAGIAVNALGHADEGFLKVLTEQAGKFIHTSNVYHNEWAGKLAELLVMLTRHEGGLGFVAGDPAGAKVFFANSGTEANEGALKIARKVGKDRWAAAVPGRSWDSPDCDKTGIVCFEGSFHGRTMGSLSVTSNPKYQKPFSPLLAGVAVGKLNDFECLDRLIQDETCVVIVEPVQGEGGINVAKEGWLRALRKRCDEVGAVLVFDEIQCGLYRTGTLWAHSCLTVDCHPDMVTTAKSLANGYPIGAVLLKDSIASTMTAGSHGTTFGGSPLACALGHYVLTRLSHRSSIEHVKETSAYLKSRLELLPKWFPDTIQPEVRGRGLIVGLGFKDEKMAGQVVSMARERGVLALTAGKDVVRMVPSLTVCKEEVDVAVDVIESCVQVMRSESQ